MVVCFGLPEFDFGCKTLVFGLNQSHHRIYITMTASVSILLPIETHTITTMEHILICESIIIGEVPETYLNTDNLTNALNLIPN